MTISESCLALAILPVCTMLAASSVLISIHTQQSPRPLLDASVALTRKLNVPVDYEDPAVVFNGDLTDITQAIASPSKRVGNAGSMRVLGTRRTTLDIQFAASRSTPDAAVQAVLDAYNNNVLPIAKFSLHRVGAHLEIAPDLVRDRSGAVVRTPTLLDTRISAPAGTQSLYNTLKQFCIQLSGASGTRVDLGTIPLNYTVQTDVAVPAQTGSARQILVQILDGGYWHLPRVPAPKRQLTWQLLYDPTFAFYVLNLSIPDVDIPSANGGIVTRMMTRP